MSIHRMVQRGLCAIVLSCVAVATLSAQQPPPGQRKKKPVDSAKIAKDSAKMAKAAKDSGSVGRFFQSETPLNVTLTLNIKRIRGDKGDLPPWRAATLSYAKAAPDTAAISIPVRVKTRGIWRLKNCDFPPIWLNFSGNDVKGTEFKGLDQIKLTSYCRNNDEYERYILQELQLNRALRLITPVAHAVRAVHVTYVDSASKKVEATRWAIFQEEPLTLAGRLNARLLRQTGAGPDDLDPHQSAIFGLFQYFVGNTDFSISGLHNVELLGLNNGLSVYPVAHDFDFSGAVNSRYATTPPQLGIRTVRERLYRGYCVPPAEFEKGFALFNAKKDSIYALYRDPIGKLLPEGTVKETLQYFDDFYKTINNPKDAREDVIKRCLNGKA
jgi:hypothetical protein